MSVPLKELVGILGQEKALEFCRLYEGEPLPRMPALNKFCRDEEIRKLWNEGVSLSVVAERTGVSYRTALRVVQRSRN